MQENSNLLSSQQIQERLHRYNLTNDMSVFNDVPEDQHHLVMYPSVARRLDETEEQYRQKLIELFGPLPN